jgi:hypothetical protein
MVVFGYVSQDGKIAISERANLVVSRPVTISGRGT